MTTVTTDSTNDQTQANRIALRKMFKAIAEYGRQVRLRKQSNGTDSVQETPEGQETDNEIGSVRRRKYRRKKGTT